MRIIRWDWKGFCFISKFKLFNWISIVFIHLNIEILIHPNRVNFILKLSGRAQVSFRGARTTAQKGGT